MLFNNCDDQTITGLASNATDEQRAFCNNDETCIFDLLATGNQELAALTRDASADDKILQQTLSKHNFHLDSIAYALNFHLE